MVKNLVFDIGGVLAEEVGTRSLTNLGTEEQRSLSDLVYDKSQGFIDTLLGLQTSAEYKRHLIAKYPEKAEEINFLLNPANLPITYPVKTETLDALYRLKQNYKIYFLSNIERISLDYLNPILKDFDGGAYSCEEHLKKPDPRFFQILLDRYRLSPAETLFFDDREHNVTAAKCLGINAMVFNNIDCLKEVLK